MLHRCIGTADRGRERDGGAAVAGRRDRPGQRTTVVGAFALRQMSLGQGLTFGHVPETYAVTNAIQAEVRERKR